MDKRREIALDEVKHFLVQICGGKSDEAQRAKAAMLDKLFNEVVWSAVEVKPLDDVERAAKTLRRLADKLKSVQPESLDDLLKLAMVTANEVTPKAPASSDDDDPQWLKAPAEQAKLELAQ